MNIANILIEPELLWLTIIALAGITTFVAINITNFIAILTNNTKLGGAAAGMLIVSVISSLPELVVIITSSVNDQPYLAFSDVVGANIMTAFMIAVSAIVFAHKAKLTYTTRSNKLCIYAALIIYVIIGGFVLLSPTHMFNIDLSAFKLGLPLIVVVIIYLAAVYLTGEEDEQFKEDHYLTSASRALAGKKDQEMVEKPKYSINTYIVLTVVFSIMLIALASLLSLAADRAAGPEGYNIGHGIAGALILAVVTSIPEISSLFNLTKLGMRNIAIAGVVGSHIFNFFLLIFGDVFFKESFIYEAYKGHEVEFIALLVMVIVLSLLLVLSFSKVGARTKVGDYSRYLIIFIFFFGWVFIKAILPGMIN